MQKYDVNTNFISCDYFNRLHYRYCLSTRLSVCLLTGAHTGAISHSIFCSDAEGFRLSFSPGWMVDWMVDAS